MDVPPEDWQSCRACRADIVFGRTSRTSKGKPVVMPVDVKPADNGTVALSKQDGVYYAGVVRKNQAAGMRDRGVGLHVSHFATCPQGARFRRYYPDAG